MTAIRLRRSGVGGMPIVLCMLVAFLVLQRVDCRDRLRSRRAYSITHRQQNRRSLWRDGYWNGNELSADGADYVHRDEDGGVQRELRSSGSSGSSASKSSKSARSSRNSYVDDDDNYHSNSQGDGEDGRPDTHGPTVAPVETNRDEGVVEESRSHKSTKSHSSSDSGKGKGGSSSKSSKSTKSTGASDDVEVQPTSSPTTDLDDGNSTDSTDDLPLLGANLTVFAFQPAATSVIPPTPSGSDTEAGALFLFTNFTRNVTNVGEFPVAAAIGLEEILLIWIRVDGYCQRLETNGNAGLCQFTYTAVDPDTEMVLGSFVASGFLRIQPSGVNAIDVVSVANGGDPVEDDDAMPAESAVLAVKGGTDLFEGVTGQVYINPADLNRDFDPPRIEESSGDILSDPEGYVHVVFLYLDAFFSMPMEDA